MNPQEKLDLNKLLGNMDDYVDNTAHIRNVRHSLTIRDEIRKMELLKRDQATLRVVDFEKFRELAMNTCVCLYTDYMDIFNKLLKDEIDLDIMSRLLETLKLIEDERVDQHEGSVIIGKILKELYLDSAIKRADNLDKEHEGGEQVVLVEHKEISWREFKLLNSK